MRSARNGLESDFFRPPGNPDASLALDAEHALSGVDVDLAGVATYLNPTTVPTPNGVSELLRHGLYIWVLGFAHYLHLIFDNESAKIR